MPLFVVSGDSIVRAVQARSYSQAAERFLGEEATVAPARQGEKAACVVRLEVVPGVAAEKPWLFWRKASLAS